MNDLEMKKAIAQFVLENAADITDPLTKDELEKLIADKIKPNSSLYLNFTMPGYDNNKCDVEVKKVVDWENHGVTDEEGNVWSNYHYSFKMNYPSYGATELNLVSARLEFMEMVLRLALQLQEKFANVEVRELIYTAAEVKENEIKKLRVELEGHLVASIKNGRINTIKFISLTDEQMEKYSFLKDDKEFELKSNGKTYRVVRLRDNELVIKRTV